MAHDDDDDLTSDLTNVTAMAERLGLKGRDKKEYIDRHMTGFGYKATTSYVRPDDDDDNGGGGFFGRSSNTGRRGRRNRDDDDDI